MNYYNENDPKASAWLESLIGAGLIPKGHIDERSIAEVQPGDLIGYAQCHFFAGIGGWAYALQLAGWPESKPVWTGSCPCQPFSVAGLRRGTDDPRHLWPEFARLIGERKPPAIFGEQVGGSAGLEWLAGVRADLEEMGYAVGGADLCAAGVGAPHIRQRLYWTGRLEVARYGSGQTGNGSAENEPSTANDKRPSPTRGLEHAPGSRHEEEGESGQSEGRRGVPRARRGPSGMADADSSRHKTFGVFDQEQARQASLQSPSRRMADADEQGQGQRRAEPEGSAFAFGNSQAIPCADGKVRRIPAEPAFYPLAHGLPARVVRLRGYGNAIVPQVAAEFVIAAKI